MARVREMGFADKNRKYAIFFPSRNNDIPTGVGTLYVDDKVCFFPLFFSRKKFTLFSSREQTMLITLKRVTPFAAELSLHIA